MDEAEIEQVKHKSQHGEPPVITTTAVQPTPVAPPSIYNIQSHLAFLVWAVPVKADTQINWLTKIVST